MSNWFYVGLAYGGTYLVLALYTIYLIRRRSSADEALQAEKHRAEA